MFGRPTKCWVRPKEPTFNQEDKNFYCNFPLGEKILINSDQYDQYYITQAQFKEQWEIISYFGASKYGTIKTKFNGKPVIYHDEKEIQHNRA